MRTFMLGVMAFILLTATVTIGASFGYHYYEAKLTEAQRKIHYLEFRLIKRYKVIEILLDENNQLRIKLRTKELINGPT